MPVADFSLPPHLTREYDFAGGFRGLGNAYLRGQALGLQRQQTQAELERQRLLLEDTKRKAANQLRRQVAMQQAALDFQQELSKDPNADPVKVQTRVLTKHAPDIFADDPASLVNFITRTEATQARAENQQELTKLRQDAFKSLDEHRDEVRRLTSERDLDRSTAKQLDQQIKFLEMQLKHGEEGEGVIPRSTTIDVNGQPVGVLYNPKSGAFQMPVTGDLLEQRTINGQPVLVNRKTGATHVVRPPPLARSEQKQVDDLTQKLIDKQDALKKLYEAKPSKVPLLGKSQSDIDSETAKLETEVKELRRQIDTLEKRGTTGKPLAREPTPPSTDKDPLGLFR